MRDDRYHVFTTKTIKVLLVAAVLTALLLTAFVIPSSREFIVDNFEIFSTYELTESNNNSVNGEITVGYVPEGFELVENGVYSKVLYSEYVSKENNALTIYKYPSSMKVDFDTETGNAEYITFDNVTYTVCTDANKIYTVVWTQNDYIYQVYGQFEKKDILKIAQSVK